MCVEVCDTWEKMKKCKNVVQLNLLSMLCKVFVSGPVSADPTVLEKMVKTGMNKAQLNSYVSAPMSITLVSQYLA